MGTIYRLIYGLPFHTIVTLLALVYIFWCWKERECSSKIKNRLKLVFGLFFFCWLATVIFFTIFSRSGVTRIVVLKQLQFIEAFFESGKKELIRSAWMNVVLFIPGGILLTELIGEIKPGWKLWITVLCIMFCISLSIEVSQWYWQLGKSEVDDVFGNVLGAGIGVYLVQAARFKSK